MPYKTSWLLLAFGLATLSSCLQLTFADIPSSQLPLEARDDSGSQEDELISTSYVLPNQIFNDGKPYYAGKDPISGQLDFSAKKQAGIETAVNEVYDPKEKIVLTSSSPNIHDFLNLPVKYSSSKFVYPLVSSSYANLKYQGSNKNYITNKKPVSIVAPATPPPNYHSQNYFTVPTTKLMAVPPTTAGTQSNDKPSTTTTTTTTTTTSLSTTTATSTKPTTSTQTIQITQTTPTTTSSTTSTSAAKYTTSTRKPAIITTTYVPRTTASPTRKKFVPTKKYNPTTTPASSTTSMRFPNERPTNTSASKITTTVHTTYHPTPQSSIFPTELVSSTKLLANTSKPIVFNEEAKPTKKPSTGIADLNVADVYQTLGHKHNEQKHQEKDTMTLSDIFNSLAEEESALSISNQANQGFDAEGNLMQPIAPSKPSPFSMQSIYQQLPPHTTRPAFTAGSKPLNPHKQSPQQHLNESPSSPHFVQDPKLSSIKPDSYNNEYVSYQVQQPNVLQYRPLPGAINNVVISPGQNSASFVLGSQQQVGTNGVGSVEKEPLFGKEPVQYGTVISEDINSVPRPGQTLPHKISNYGPNSYMQNAGAGSSVFQQSNNFAHGPSVNNQFPNRQPQDKHPPNKHYQTEPPAPPSPYQQLPLIGNPIRSQHQVTQKQQQSQASALPQQVSTAEAPQQSQEVHYQVVGPKQPVSQQTNVQTQSNIGAPQDTKELLVTTNIRFPAIEDQSDEASALPSNVLPPQSPQVNGHAQPLSLQQIQQTNTIAFPKTKDELHDETAPQDISDIEIQKHEVLTMNQHKKKLSFPQLPDHVAPSTHMEPPPRFPATEYADTPKRPGLNRPLSPPQFAYNEYTRKPVPGISRPNPERHLPNILPQFRPNAKLSGGHPPANFNQEPGNIRIQGQPPKRNSNGPQFAHRRQTLTQQKSYPMNRLAEYPAGAAPTPNGEANRRVYRLPPYGGQNSQMTDRVYSRRPMPHALRPVDQYGLERHSYNPDAYKTLPQQTPLMPLERLAAFEEEDLVINDPPQPITPNKDAITEDDTKLEPVVTLQMLQSQKKTFTNEEDTGAGEIQVPALSSDDVEDVSTTSQNGLYVVYPMQGNKADINEAAESKEPLPAVAHIEPSSGSEYQNTPFSVVRDQPQEPILKNKKPQSLQQQTNSQIPKDKFPYPIEKPDPSYTELNPHKRVPGVLIAPRIINGAYGSGTETPIAIAYSPTESNPFKRIEQNSQRYSNVNLASAVISEIRTDTQTEQAGLNNDFDVRGQNFEKDFMAPFYPSVSLGSAANPPSNGWNIIKSTTDNVLYEKNKINRADVTEMNDGVNAENDATTAKTFELDTFQPELQGGFKPIYPPGYKADGNEETVIPQETNNLPLALASRMEPFHKNYATSSTSTSSTSTSTTTTTTTTSTQKPQISEKHSALESANTTATQMIVTTTTKPTATTTTVVSSTTQQPPTTPTPTIRKKSAFETSLEALLFGDDEDFEQEEGRKQKNIRPQIEPRMVPRMGPRNLKMS